MLHCPCIVLLVNTIIRDAGVGKTSTGASRSYTTQVHSTQNKQDQIRVLKLKPLNLKFVYEASWFQLA